MEVIVKQFQNLFIVFIIVTFALSACSSDEEKKLSHLQKGNTYFEKGEYKSAQLEFKNALQIDAKYADAYEKLAETDLKLGDARGAFRAYSAVAELEPDNTRAQLKLATFLMLAKKFDDARKKVDAVLAAEPENVEALLLQASLLGQENKPDEAEAIFRRVIAIDGNQTRAYLGLAYLLARQKKPDEAEALLKKAVKIDPANVKTRLALFNFYISRKKI